MKLSSFEVLTFDCYGTLIDWESGILRAVSHVLDAHGRELPPAEILEHFARFESTIQGGAYLTYREVLSRVVDEFGRELGFVPSPGERASLPGSIARWAPFDDTVEALRILGSRYRLGVISNVDDDLFAFSRRRLGVEFDQVVTAQQVGSYKPDARNFELALERLGRPVGAILHVAQSLFHDIAPAKRLGFATVHVNRVSPHGGSGATMPVNARPDLEVPDLRSLAEMVLEEDDG
jgi:2-haloacid dehalogenase